jgi:CheY-like chemotaxis protein
MSVSRPILLVDNIPDHALRYREALLERGYRVQHASTGGEALELAGQSPPACVVIDVRLPDMSGWDLCRALKADDATKRVPVMVLTRDTSREHALESARAHCNAWVAQPVQAEELVRAMEHVLAQEEPAPASPEQAVLGVRPCPACESDFVRATLRLRPIQYYACKACGHAWPVEAV